MRYANFFDPLWQEPGRLFQARRINGLSLFCIEAMNKYRNNNVENRQTDSARRYFRDVTSGVEFKKIECYNELLRAIAE